MGRLSGFSYREIAKRLKALGFAFDRQAAGSHEVWFNEQSDKIYHNPQPSWRYAGRHSPGHPQTGRHLA
jgi:predicted RNA binding protein YcfA (HicA-like mRNA interferase family)